MCNLKEMTLKFLVYCYDTCFSIKIWSYYLGVLIVSLISEYSLASTTLKFNKALLKVDKITLKGFVHKKLS